MAQTEWHERLKREVPRADIVTYLSELQALVAGLRRFRDDLKVPSVDDVRPLLTPALVAHAGLTCAYLDDARYRDVVVAAIALDPGAS